MARNRSKPLSTSGKDAIRARLEQLATEHGLSGLAQRTDTPVSSVHRYVNGGKVPAEFCAALAESFQVNLAWLLLGRGSKYATDMGKHEAEVAGGMREIVDAMNAASRLKLGSIAYRTDLSLLRDLSTAAKAHEQLRERLTERIEPVAQEWLAALRAAMEKRDRERAQDIVSALERLLSFSDDPRLRLDFDRHLAMHAYVQGRRTEAADRQRRNLLARLAETGEVTSDTLRESYNLCAALSSLGRIEEGRRFARATLTLRGDTADEPIARMLRCILGLFELALGNVQPGLALVTQAYLDREEHDRRTSEFLMPTALLRSGVASIESVVRDFPMSVQLAVELLRTALFRENEHELELVLNALAREGLETLGTSQLFVAQARWVYAGLRGNKRRPGDEEFSQLEPALLLTPGLGALEVAILRCQRARLDGARNASSLALRAEKELVEVPMGVTADQLARGLHARNVLQLVPRRAKLKAAAEAAGEYLRDSLGQGLGMFRELAEEHGIK